MKFNFIETEEIKQIFYDFENDRNMYITGNAGTGKTALIEEFEQRSNKNIVRLAPTGLAASLIGGSTIHSFFKIPFESLMLVESDIQRNPKLYNHVDTIIIDEISMVRADIFDIMDTILKNTRKSKLPFGGVQMIFLGDHFQLPPVLVSKEKKAFNRLYKGVYFFNSNVFNELDTTMKYHKLTRIFRQKDREFVHFLNKIRDEKIEEDIAKKIKIEEKDDIDFDKTVFLSATNKVVNLINEQLLSGIDEELKTYEARGKQSKKYNVPIFLKIKKTAKIIFCKNDPLRRYVNGTLGFIEDIIYRENDDDILKIRCDNGNLIDVLPDSFHTIEYKYNEEKEKIEIHAKNEMIQYPIKLAWALTIHKAQGQTFERSFVDFSTIPFAHGQLYVALSRCKSIEGLTISRKLNDNMIIMDDKIKEFDGFVNKNIEIQNKMKLI